jgi:hypothetical protein
MPPKSVPYHLYLPAGPSRPPPPPPRPLATLRPATTPKGRRPRAPPRRPSPSPSPTPCPASSALAPCTLPRPSATPPLKPVARRTLHHHPTTRPTPRRWSYLTRAAHPNRHCAPPFKPHLKARALHRGSYGKVSGHSKVLTGVDRRDAPPDTAAARMTATPACPVPPRPPRPPPRGRRPCLGLRAPRACCERTRGPSHVGGPCTPGPPKPNRAPPQRPPTRAAAHAARPPQQPRPQAARGGSHAPCRRPCPARAPCPARRPLALSPQPVNAMATAPWWCAVLSLPLPPARPCRPAPPSSCPAPRAPTTPRRRGARPPARPPPPPFLGFWRAAPRRTTRRRPCRSVRAAPRGPAPSPFHLRAPHCIRPARAGRPGPLPARPRPAKRGAPHP